MKFTILYSINRMSLDGITEYKTKFFNISNEDSIRKEFYNSEFLLHAGKLETQRKEKSTFAYCDMDAPNELRSKSDIELKKILGEQIHARIQLLNSLLSFTWFVKDQSISVINGIGQVPERKNCTVIYTDPKDYTNSLCNHVVTPLSKAELEKAHEIWLQYSKVCFKEITQTPIILNEENIKEPITIKGHPENFDYSEYNCIERAMVFLATARSAGYVMYKIALYMPIFECLFTTDKNELTQKISQLTAFYLGKNRADRIRIFDTIRQAYDIRSIFFHGGQFGKEDKRKHYPKFNLIASQLDEIVRELLTKVIMNDSELFKDNEARIKYLKYLIFQPDCKV